MPSLLRVFTRSISYCTASCRASLSEIIMELRLEQRHGIPVSRCRAKKKKKLWEVITAAAFFLKKKLRRHFFWRLESASDVASASEQKWISYSWLETSGLMIKLTSCWRSCVYKPQYRDEGPSSTVCPINQTGLWIISGETGG